MKRGFTLVELLVVVTIIAILVALLLPAVNKPKSIGQRVACISNQRRLQAAHTLFGNDHDNRILYSSAWKQERSAPYAWMSGSLNLSKYLNQSKHLKGTPLYPYVGESVGVFKCPADKDMVRVLSREGRVKSLFPRHRSYSVNIHVGGWSGWPVQED